MGEKNQQSSKKQTTSTLPIKIYGVDLVVKMGLPLHDRFWRIAGAGDWEDDTLSFVARNITSQTTVLDIGAWIGPITILASKLGRHVYSVEPNPVAGASLKENVSLNNSDNVTIFDCAICEESDELTLYTHRNLEDSQTSALGNDSHAAIKVPTMSLSELSKKAPEDKPLLVKIDIEGFEYQLAPAIYRLMEDRKPLLHLSLHPRIMSYSKTKKLGRFAARYSTLRETLGMVKTLQRFGRIQLDQHPNEFLITFNIFRLIMAPWRRPRNFSINVKP